MFECVLKSFYDLLEIGTTRGTGACHLSHSVEANTTFLWVLLTTPLCQYCGSPCGRTSGIQLVIMLVCSKYQSTKLHSQRFNDVHVVLFTQRTDGQNTQRQILEEIVPFRALFWDAFLWSRSSNLIVTVPFDNFFCKLERLLKIQDLSHSGSN